MLRTAMIAGLIASASVSAPAFAADAAAAATGYTTADTSIGTLLDDTAAKAVLDKYMPQFSSNPQVDMARGMTLKQVQQFAPEKITDEVLAKVDADLSKLPVRK
ncbi:MAG: hypothetical protein ABIW31_04010 [Novosphingobium sp.]